MSLLTACQAVALETGLLSSPATVISNTNASVVQLLALMTRSATELLRQKDWQRLVREHTITTAAGTESYALPSDWSRYTSETAWDATNYWPMRGSLDPQYWTALKRGIVVLTIRKRFRVKGNLVYIIPTPTVSSESLIIEYMRNTPWTDSTGVTFRTAPTVDTDLSVIPESVLIQDTIWRLRRAKGLDYADFRQDAEDAASVAYAQDVPAMVINDGLPSNFTPPFFPVVPQVIT